MIKNLQEIEPFTAGDLTQIRELLHPKNDGIELPYSLAVANLAPGESSLPHRLKSSEVYFILKGEGLMHIGDESRTVSSGDLIHIPANEVQYIRNSGTESLEFICIVSPAWSPDDEVVL